MITLIASYLHIGDYKSGYRDFMNFLDSQDDIGHLIVAGDFFDLWVVGTGRALKEGKYVIDYLSERFGNNVAYLTGNHDEDFKHLKSLNGIRIKRFHVFKYGTKRILVCHGHEYDPSPYLTTFRSLAKFNAWVVNKTDQLFGIDTRKWLVSLSDQVENDPYDKLLFTYEFNLRKEFSGVHDIVITGHTHQPCIKEFTDLVYINVGDSMQHRTAVLFDDELGIFNLLNYKSLTTLSKFNVRCFSGDAL